MTDLAATQAKADAVAATFNRALRNVHDLPWAACKVAGIQRVRDLFDEIRQPGSVLILDQADEVEATIQGMEQGCRERGLYQQFAELSRADRRRLKRDMGEI